MLTTVTIILAAATLLLLAIAMSAVLGWASHKFHVPVDLRIEEINNALPSANCGACGYVGCNEYAEAVVRDGAAVDLCPVGGAAAATAVGEIMGVTVSDSLPQRPVVHCVASQGMRLRKHEYRGEQTCHAANMVAGIQGCPYGCLGYGDCVKVCEYDAIDVIDGVARVNYVNCVGCGKCIEACPRNIISNVPFKAERILAVQCSNKDFGKEVMAVCTMGCTGCKACSRAITGLITFKDNLPQINIEAYDPRADLQEVQNRCPREAMVWIGKPSEADLKATEDQELPRRAEADFKTTVDDAEWRG